MDNPDRLGVITSDPVLPTKPTWEYGAFQIEGQAAPATDATEPQVLVKLHAVRGISPLPFVAEIKKSLEGTLSAGTPSESAAEAEPSHARTFKPFDGVRLLDRFQ